MEKQTSHFQGRVGAAKRASGPLSFMNPTTRYVSIDGEEAPLAQDGPDAEASNRRHADGQRKPYYIWRSRDSRKGRHAVAAGKESLPQKRRMALRGIGKLFTRYPVWDVTYDVAIMFMLGSIVWVLNGFFVWWPLYDPSSVLAPTTKMSGGVSAFIGATIFEVGGILMMLEAVNENRADCFGWAMKEAAESGESRLEPSNEECRHSRKGRRLLAEKRGEDENNKASAAEKGNAQHEEGSDTGHSWRWWPSAHELRTHYFKEIGFWACTIQLMGASVFWISGLTGLPPILNALSLPASNGIYWLPQVIGGTGFIISGAMFALESQSKWYLPAPLTLGWHVGFWNFLGGIGFTMCGAFGFDINSAPMEFASTLSTFIGAWAFLIGSAVQWYESLNKYAIWSGEPAPED